MTSTKPKIEEETARREFMKQVGKAAATAPAIALLLAASSKPAAARPNSFYLTPDGAGDSGLIDP